MEQREYFVQISEPMDIRREILSTSKQIVMILQRVDRIRALRIKKIEKIAEIRNLNKEIRMLVNKLKKTLPETGMRIPIKESPTKEKGKTRKTGNELKQLEEELRMIEHKIGLMSK